MLVWPFAGFLVKWPVKGQKEICLKMNDTSKYVCLAVLMLCAPFLRAEKLPPLPEGAFTYVVIPDTQLYHGKGAKVKKGRKSPKGPASNPAFQSRVEWIAANIEKEKIVFVSHVGDIVDVPNDSQWALASGIMSQLDGKVPYGIAPGNHDMVGGSTALFNEWFPSSRYEANAWYAGAFAGYVNGEGRKVCSGNADSCQLFEAGGMKFVVLHLECNAPVQVLEWADSMLEKHSDRKAIVCTHMFLGFITKESNSGGWGKNAPPGGLFGCMQWKKRHGDEGVTAVDMWEKCFSKHKNLFLIVCGDQGAAICWRETMKGVHGNTVHAVLQDYPRTADNEDWIRLYRFLPAQRKIDVWTYSPQRDRVCLSAGFRKGRDWHVFSLPLD